MLGRLRQWIADEKNRGADAGDRLLLSDLSAFLDTVPEGSNNMPHEIKAENWNAMVLAIQDLQRQDSYYSVTTKYGDYEQTIRFANRKELLDYLEAENHGRPDHPIADVTAVSKPDVVTE